MESTSWFYLLSITSWGGGGTASLATVFSWAVADQDACAPHHRARAMALSSPVRSSQESASLVETRRTDAGRAQGVSGCSGPEPPGGPSRARV